MTTIPLFTECLDFLDSSYLGVPGANSKEISLISLFRHCFLGTSIYLRTYFRVFRQQKSKEYKKLYNGYKNNLQRAIYIFIFHHIFIIFTPPQSSTFSSFHHIFIISPHFHLPHGPLHNHLSSSVVVLKAPRVQSHIAFGAPVASPPCATRFPEIEVVVVVVIVVVVVVVVLTGTQRRSRGSA